MKRTRVKFCGITCREDAHAAAEAGADSVGFLFYPPAPAALTAEEAAAAAAALPPFVSTVALFVNAAAEEVRRVITALNPALLQFHGDEAADFCRRFERPYLKACRVKNAEDIAAAAAAHPDCSGLLLDAYAEGCRGGSGQQFDWEHIPFDCPLPLIIAGGLNADNVGDLIRAARPWGVDTSSGIAEINDRRRKNSDKMKAFMKSVRDADIH